jgi:UDP:flavonoid glycosyltransferase YjiC (YdhE family)
VWKIHNPITALREGKHYMVQGWPEMSKVLIALADDADLILTGSNYQELAANVAEYYGVPLAALQA